MDTFWFWLTAAGMSLAVAALLVRSLLRAPDAPADTLAADLQVYRDQLAETERDIARGTLTAAEAQRLKTEIARRILETDRAATTAAATGTGPVSRRGAGVAAGLAALGCLGALLVYAQTGVPWYPDMPIKDRLASAEAAMASRPSQAEAEAAAPAFDPPQVDAEFAALMDKLRAAIDPATATDLRGLDLLARNEAALGNFPAAQAAQRRLIAVKGAAATGEDHAMLAELLISAAGGYVSPEAEAELIRALELDPANGTARYFSGLMFAQGGRFDRTFALWEPLLREGPADAPWVAAIRGQIEDVAMRAGISYQLPEASGGPTASDMAAAADMTPEERQAMIEGMVGQLQDRLTAEGGSAADWAKLINALGVLGRTDEARKAYDTARAALADSPDDLATVDAAAEAAGVSP